MVHQEAQLNNQQILDLFEGPELHWINGSVAVLLASLAKVQWAKAVSRESQSNGVFRLKIR